MKPSVSFRNGLHRGAMQAVLPGKTARPARQDHPFDTLETAALKAERDRFRGRLHCTRKADRPVSPAVPMPYACTPTPRKIRPSHMTFSNQRKMEREGAPAFDTVEKQSTPRAACRVPRACKPSPKGSQSDRHKLYGKNFAV